MRIVHAKTDYKRKVNIFADDNVFGDPATDPELADDETLEDGVEDFEEEDMGSEGEQDGSTIDVDNNIVNHLIAECANCHGIFISAMLASDQVIESINGVCPLCNKDTEQFLKWIVKDYPEE